MAKFTLFKGNNGEFYFNLKAGNGEIIGKSEGYKAKDSALNGVQSVQKNAISQERFELKQAANDKWHFNLKATNGQIILSSQMYASKDGAQNGIDSVIRHAPEADLDDETSAA